MTPACAPRQGRVAERVARWVQASDQLDPWRPDQIGSVAFRYTILGFMYVFTGHRDCSAVGHAANRIGDAAGVCRGRACLPSPNLIRRPTTRGHALAHAVLAAGRPLGAGVRGAHAAAGGGLCRDAPSVSANSTRSSACAEGLWRSDHWRLDGRGGSGNDHDRVSARTGVVDGRRGSGLLPVVQ